MRPEHLGDVVEAEQVDLGEVVDRYPGELLHGGQRRLAPGLPALALQVRDP